MGYTGHLCSVWKELHKHPHPGRWGPPGRLASIIALAKTKPANCRLRLKILSQKEAQYRTRSCFMRGLLETCLPPRLKTESRGGPERIFAYFPKNIFYYSSITCWWRQIFSNFIDFCTSIVKMYSVYVLHKCIFIYTLYT